MLSPNSRLARLITTIGDPNIIRVYITTLMLGLAYGMAISLLAIFLDQRGFDKPSIGTLAAWFAGGIVSFSLPMGGLIRRFSAKRTLTVSLVGYAMTVSAFPFLHSYAGIAAVRFCDGAFSVGIWVSCETILLARSGANNKAFVMSLYALAIACGYVGGPIVSRILAASFSLNAGFVSAGVLSALAAVYTHQRMDPDVRNQPASDNSGTLAPTHGEASSGVSTLELLWRIKNSCFGTFAYGYFQASVVLFLPLFLIESRGISTEQTILIPAFFAGGMLVFINIAGRIGDRFGHLLTMRVLASVGCTMVLGFAFLHSYTLMCVAVAIAGATLASISPVSLALQGVVVAREDYARATSIYNGFYAGGMLLGPYISAMIFERQGGAFMLYHLAGLWMAFVLFSIIFYRDDPAARGVVLRGASSAG